MAYIGNQPVPQATQTRDRFVATASQTSFATSGYTPGFLDVYLNGVKLDSTDYTATNGSDVVLASGAASGDIVEVVAFSAFEAANALPSQTGNSGKYLTTDGSTASWDAPFEGGVVINESGADVDFRVESDTKGYAFFVDGATGNVGINQVTAPLTPLHMTGGTDDANVQDYIRFSRTGYEGAGFHQTISAYCGSVSSQNGIVFKTSNGTSAPSERMRIDGNGHVKRLNVPAFYAGVSQTRGSGAFDAYTTERFDNGGHFNATNGRFTAPVDGYYQFNGTQNTLSVTVGQWIGISFVVNASTGYAGTYNIASSANDNGIGISAVIYLTANDYVTLNAINQSSIVNQVTFSGHHIG